VLASVACALLLYHFAKKCFSNKRSKSKLQTDFEQFLRKRGFLVIPPSSRPADGNAPPSTNPSAAAKRETEMAQASRQKANETTFV
jgi:hypothetical protein